MMIRKIPAHWGCALLCLLSAVVGMNTCVAGEALDAVNAEVEQTAQQIDEKYGVLLTGQERNALKLGLVVKKVVATAPEQSVEQKAQTAIETYEITDPDDQRKVLIEIEASFAGNGAGISPPCCG